MGIMQQPWQLLTEAKVCPALFPTAFDNTEEPLYPIAYLSTITIQCWFVLLWEIVYDCAGATWLTEEFCLQPNKFACTSLQQAVRLLEPRSCLPQRTPLIAPLATALLEALRIVLGLT